MGVSVDWAKAHGRPGSPSTVAQQAAEGLKIYTPQMFGVPESPDGSGDYFSELQRWIDACKDGRGYLPKGKYRFIGKLAFDPTASYVIEGAGADPNGVAGSVLYNAGTTVSMECDNGSGSANYLPLALRHFALLGTSSASHGINLLNIHGAKLSDLWVSQHGGNGIQCYTGWANQLERVSSTDNGQYGMLFSGLCNRLRVSGCIANNNARKSGGFANLSVTGASNSINLGVVIENTDFSDAGQAPYTTVGSAYGMVLNYCWGLQLIGNYAEKAVSLILYADGTVEGLEARGNYWQDGAVTFDGCVKSIVEGNVLNEVTAATTLTTTAIVSGGGRVGQNVLKGGATASGS